MGRLRLFGELMEAGAAAEGEEGGGTGSGLQVARVVRTTADYQTSSMSFVNIDTANLAINMNTGAGWVYLLLAGAVFVSSIQYGCFDFTVDGQLQGGAKGVQQVQAPYVQDIQISWLAQVTAGSHIFRPQWRVLGGGAVLRASSAESPALFAAIELT